MAMAAPAAAQQQLPPIIVEGATLAVPPAKPKPKPAPTPAAQTSPSPGPAPEAGPSSAVAAGGDTSGASSAEGGPGVATTGPIFGGFGSGDAVGGGAGIATGQLGSSVSVVTRQDIEGQQVRYAADALRGLPGVSVNRTGSFGGLTDVRIRGAEANHTLVLIDGVEANQATNGAFDFSNLPAEGIERIEVIKGPQSGLVGSNAIGGVVNVVTRRGEGPLSIVMKGETGSMGTRDLTGIVSGGNGLVHGALTLHRRTTDGFNIAPEGSEKDGARQELVAFKGGIQPTETFTLDFTVRRTMKAGDRDGENFMGPAGTLAIQTDTPANFRWNTLLMGAEAKLDTFEGFWTHAVRASRNHTTYEDNDFARYLDDSSIDKLAYLSTFRFASPAGIAARHTVTAMVESERETYTPVSRDNVERARKRLNTALEWRGVFMDDVALTANVRRDDNDSFDDFTTWRSSASWRIAGLAPGVIVRPHASLGTGIKYPTMFELHGEFPGLVPYISNPNLKPEESTGWDAGVEWTFLRGRTVLDLTWFDNDIRNKIEGDNNFPEMSINLPGTSRHQGLETSARFQFAPNFALAIGHTYLDARDPEGRQSTRRPRHSGSATLTTGFADGRGQIVVSAKYNGRTIDEAFLLPAFSTERVALDDYWLLGVAASYKLQPGVELFGRVENLLDATYQEVYGFESAPIAAYAGVKISLGGRDGIGASGR